jgi:hypothetical protein
MERNEIIEQLVEETLDLLERPMAPPPNPSFTDSILRAAQNHNRRHRVLRPSLRPALLAVLMTANLLFSYIYFSNSQRDDRAVSHQELVDVLMGYAGDGMQH